MMGVILIVWIFATISHLALGEVLSSEINVLEAIYDAANGDQWDWTGVPWNFSQSDPNPCTESWQGVTCQTQCNSTTCWDAVVSLYLDKLSMEGSLAAQIGDLSSLSSLTITYNWYLQGSIPSSIGNLSQLESLRLDHNSFSFAIPASIGNLTHLLEIDLSYNILSAQLPSEIGLLTQLQLLNLQDNIIVSTIPASFGNMTSLESLILTSNSFYGIFPPEMGSMTALLKLELGANDLSSTLPPELGNLSTLESLNLRFNHLIGSIPEELGNLRRLQFVDLSQNNFNGTIPSTVGQWRSIETLYFSANKLIGPIPMSMGSLSNLSYLALDGNFLSGQIPPTLGNLSSLTVLMLAINELSGTIPPQIGNLSSLTSLYLMVNHIGGSIPDSLGNLTNLVTLSLNGNHLGGSIPPSLCNAAALTSIVASENFLRSSIPPCLSQIPGLVVLYLAENLFTGALPADLANMTALEQLVLSDNLLNGVIPSNLSAMMNLVAFRVDRNMLSGTIPDAFSSLTSLTQISVSYNYLEGSVPPSITTLPRLQVLQIEANFFTGNLSFLPAHSDFLGFVNASVNQFYGTMPLLNASQLIGLDVSYNLLSGSLPALSSLPFLEVFFIHSNAFSGSVDGVFNCELEFLVNVDIGRNRFSGHLPKSLIGDQLHVLGSFVAVENCFTGTIPESFCNVSSLVTLALDGLSTATSCRIRAFPGVLPAYYLAPKAVHGTIPACLFTMPNLETLHLSGNLLSGSIPVGDSSETLLLRDLSLSHNRLTGTIPDALQRGRLWSNMDVSFNKLTGELMDHGNMSLAAALAVNINRLSGSIPRSYYDMSSVNILRGNMFGCQSRGTVNDVPRGDPYYYEYDCGSDSLSLSFIIWTALAGGCGLTLLLLVMYCWPIQQNSSALLKSLREDFLEVFSPFTEDSHQHTSSSSSANFPDSLSISMARTLLFRIVRASVLITVLIVLIALPLYTYLSLTNHESYEYQFAWTASAAFLPGHKSAIALLCLFIAMLCCFSVIRRFANSQHSKLLDRSTAVDSCEAPPEVPHYRLRAVLLATVNMAVVWAVNGAFVYLYVQLHRAEAIIIAILLSVFKLVWSLCLRNAIIEFLQVSLPGAPQSIHLNNVWYFSALMLFNTVMAPCLATLVANSSCFYYVLFAPPSISADYDIIRCEEFGSGICLLYASFTEVVDYQPPFSYAYQCSSALLADYAYVFVYKYALLGVLYPVFVLSFAYYREWSKGEPNHDITRTERLLLLLLPPIWKADRLGEQSAADNQPAFLARLIHHLEQEARRHSLFSAGDCAVRTVMMIGALLTFGVVLPPLAVVICCSLISTTLVTQSALSRFVRDGDDRVVSRAQLDDLIYQCKILFDAMQRAVAPLAILVVLFLATFVFDAEGDDGGGVDGAIMSIPLFLCPLALLIADYLWRWWVYRQPSAPIETNARTSELEFPHRNSSIGGVRTSQATASEVKSPVHLDSVEVVS